MSVVSKLKSLWPTDLHSRAFRRHLVRVSRPTSGASLILIEAFQPPSNVIALSLFAPLLAVDGVQVLAYHQTIQGPLKRLVARIRYHANPMGALTDNKLLMVAPSRAARRRAATAAVEILAGRPDPRQFESLEFEGTTIGDLVYDLYLRRTNEPTLDLADPRLLDVLTECIAYVCFWTEYFRKHPIEAVCVSHCVYHHGIPSRIALQHGIPTYQVTAESLYRMTDEFPMAYTDQTLFPEQFRQLDVDYRERGVEIARERLAKRFAGEVGVDMVYSTASAYGSLPDDENRVLAPSDRIKVLVAAHDFFDSPHSYGTNFYPDFYIWMHRLGELSQQVNYDWYVKTHPDIQGPGEEVLAEFVSKYPNFIVLPAETSHHAIIRDGIDVALTIFGTIGMEYPALGKPVVNGSRNNPHAAYEFSVTPKDVQEYEQILLNLGDHLYSPQADQILEYHFMRRIHQLQTWVFEDYDEYLRRIGGYRESMTTKAYSEYLETYSPERQERIQRALQRFLDSSDIRIGRQHFQD